LFFLENFRLSKTPPPNPIAVPKIVTGSGTSTDPLGGNGSGSGGAGGNSGLIGGKMGGDLGSVLGGGLTGNESEDADAGTTSLPLLSEAVNVKEAAFVFVGIRAAQAVTAKLSNTI
jgi:hypothetical protein